MKVTTQQMRKSVKGWLQEENATVEQALELQSAIYAGAIEGDNYKGKRAGGDDNVFIVSEYQEATGEGPGADEPDDWSDNCGCLLDTFERIRGGRPVGVMQEASAEAYSLALMIGQGDTPFNSKWARAAVKGIEDYVAEIEK